MPQIKKILDLAKTLRSDNGCPWDKEQTMETMLQCVKDELLELEEAIEKKDFDNLEEEVGDVLFSLVSIVQIASEQENVSFKNILDRIEHKIISRHTWVFGDDKASTPEEALKLWKENKKKEKK